jgi:hypothetical protein
MYSAPPEDYFLAVAAACFVVVAAVVVSVVVVGFVVVCLVHLVEAVCSVRLVVLVLFVVAGRPEHFLVHHPGVDLDHAVVEQDDYAEVRFLVVVVDLDYVVHFVAQVCYLEVGSCFHHHRDYHEIVSHFADDHSSLKSSN